MYKLNAFNSFVHECGNENEEKVREGEGEGNG